MITISPAAAAEIKRIKISRQQPNSRFRLGIKPGGCSGWLYSLDLAETINSSDRTLESNGIQILIDEESYPYLEGLKLDYSEDLVGGSFRFYNPQNFTGCSCGLSFAIDAPLAE